MATRAKKAYRIAVIDAETDPFLYGRVPEVFAWGFFDGAIYKDFWGPNATAHLLAYLESLDEPLMIYAHNGGKFDFFYLVEAGAVNNPIMIINGRLTKVGLGKHELRDSYSIIPVALAHFGDKETIDYEKFEASERDKPANKKEILHYLAKDCEALFKVVDAFVKRFGPMLTVGGTAIKELEKLHPILRGDETHDNLFRPFYYGGRVSCFEPGIHEGDFKIFDVNSMYPHVMRNFTHPAGQKYMPLDNATINKAGDIQGYKNRPYFAVIIADNHQALPTRTETGLTFDQTSGEFFACSHEIKVALKYGLINIHQVKCAWVPMALTRFDAFVDKFIAEKIEGKEKKDKLLETFSKFMLNSAYGKFGQNPQSYFDWYIKRAEEKIPSREWTMAIDYGPWEIWKKPAPKPSYFDVAIAASITSAARAVLLDALQNATRPIYCDTDSIICEALNVEKSDTALGAWKLEASGNRIGVAGKKMYALYQGKDNVKMASKGADLDPADIFDLARGKVIRAEKMGPTFKLGIPFSEMSKDIGVGKRGFIARNIRRTAEPIIEPGEYVLID